MFNTKEIKRINKSTRKMGEDDKKKKKERFFSASHLINIVLKRFFSKFTNELLEPAEFLQNRK